MQHFGKSNRFGVPAPKAGALPTALHPDDLYFPLTYILTIDTKKVKHKSTNYGIYTAQKCNHLCSKIFTQPIDSHLTS